MNQSIIVLAATLAILAGACAPEGGVGCVPGEVRECPCDLGYAGVQACEADGETWSPCDCGGDADTDTDTTWRVEPTGQRRCYDNAVEIDCAGLPCATDGGAFCGQDAEYPGSERFFSCRNADGTAQHPCAPTASDGETVIDTLTGLEWQRTWTQGLDWPQQAVALCALIVNDQQYGGHDDWRLPTFQELAGLLHYGQHSPAIDLIAFPDTPPARFWTSSRMDANLPAYNWVVDFHDGVATINEYMGVVRCVRGGPYHRTSADRYEVSGDPEYRMVHDRATGLTWTAAFASKLTWSEALSYCEGLELGGQSDWRLPDIAELRSLAEVAPDPDAPEFPEMPPEPYSILLWSSTTHAANPGHAWYMLMATGFGPVNKALKTSLLGSLCVRGGP
jgi:hypothetical protein